MIPLRICWDSTHFNRRTISQRTDSSVNPHQLSAHIDVGRKCGFFWNFETKIKKQLKEKQTEDLNNSSIQKGRTKRKLLRKFKTFFIAKNFFIAGTFEFRGASFGTEMKLILKLK